MSSNRWILGDEVYLRESASLFEFFARALRLIGAARLTRAGVKTEALVLSADRMLRFTYRRLVVCNGTIS
jgi:hypothetical protein